MYLYMYIIDVGTYNLQSQQYDIAFCFSRVFIIF